MPSERRAKGITMRADGTNTGGGTNRVSKTAVYKAEQVQTMMKAAQLRAAGSTFREIGATLGIDPSWAQTLVYRALQETQAEAVDLMRTEEGGRLDRLQRALWGQAMGGDVKAAMGVLRIMERRARLFGLDAPVQLEIGEVANHEEVDEALQVILGQLA